jgi:serine/threonine protein kinase
MELLEGETLGELVARRGPLPVEEAMRILEGILGTLVATHDKGIIHRDLKPSNVFLATTPEGPRVKVLDFGIARRLDREEAITHPNMTLGSIGFMGPEHLEGAPVPASDLYSLGCLAWVLLTGKRLFDFREPVAVMRHHLATPAPSLRSERPDAPPELEVWVSWLLEKRVDDRPFSAKVALEALREAEAMAFGEQTISASVDYRAIVRALDRRARTAARARMSFTDAPTARIPMLGSTRTVAAEADSDRPRREAPTLPAAPRAQRGPKTG